MLKKVEAYRRHLYLSRRESGPYQHREEGDDVLVYEGDIDIQGIISPPPDLSDLFAFYLERKYRIED